MKIIEDLYVYKNEYGYSTLLKNQDEKMYVSVVFKKGQEPTTDVAKLSVIDGFLSFYKNKEGMAKPKIVVLDYVIQDLQSADNESDLPF